MKKLLTFFMMSILAFGVGWAAETVYYTLDGTQTGGSNGYATESEITQDGITWMVTGNTTMSPWRIGGKNLSNVDRDAYSTTAMGSAISRIDLQLGSITCTANSVKLTVASDASFSNVLDVVTKSSVSANSTLEFAPSSGTEWAKNAYYKFTFNVTCGSSNQFVCLSKAIFYANEGTAPSVATPVISGTTPFDGSTQVTITCATTGASIYYTTDGTDPTTSSTLYSAPFTITQTTTVKAIAELDGETSNIATKGFTANLTISSIAEFNALAVNANFKYTGNNLVYIISNSGGNNHYVQDGSKGMLIYGSLGQTYQPGDEIPGGFTGTRAEYNGAPEMTNPAGFTASTNNAGLTPVEITPSEVNLANFGRYVIIKNAAFNTSAKTITASGETIAYHTTFNNNIPTDGAAYDVIGVTGFYNNNPQFLPISFEPSAVTGADYYLIGSFNEWTQQDENYKFTALADGGYILNNKTLPDGVRFKILKVENGNVAWFGGSANDYFGINKDVCTNIQLVDGADFMMEAGGICSFTISSDMKLSVSKEAQLFLTGTINNWGKTDALEATEDGWIIEKALATGDEFKFIDEWGTWYGGGNTIAEANLGATITLNNGGNFVMAVDGNFTINVAADKSNFVITREAVTSTAMFDFDNDYATLFPDLAGTSSGTSSDGDITEAMTATVDGVSLTVSPSTTSTPNRIWNTSPRLRMYGGTITITAPEGYNLTGIEISQGKWNNSNSADEGTLTSTSWTGETHTLVITIAGNTQFKNMNVTIAQANANAPAAPVIEGETPFIGSTEVTITCATDGASIHYTTDGTDPTIESTLYQSPFTINQGVTIKARAYSQGGVASTITSKEFVKIPELANLDAFYDYYDSDEFAFTGNLVAIAQTGKYLYAQDDDRGVLIYGDIEPAYQKGDKIPAPFYAKKGTYADAPQMTNPREMQAATESVTLEPIEITIAQASNENNLYRYAVIKDVTIADEKIVVGDEELDLFNRFNIDINPVEGQLYNVIGVVGWFNGAQFLPLEIEAVVIPEYHYGVEEEVKCTLLNSNGFAHEGDTITMRIAPDSGTKLKEVKVYKVTGYGQDKVETPIEFTINESEAGDLDLVFVMPAMDVEVHAICADAFAVYVNAGDHGSAQADLIEAYEGETVTVTTSPDSKYWVDEIYYTYTVNDVEMSGELVVGENDGTYTFSMPAAVANVYVTFNAYKLKYDTTLAGGTVSVKVNGEDYESMDPVAVISIVDATVTPDEGYEIESFKVYKGIHNADDDFLGVEDISYDIMEGAYHFEMAYTDATILVTFREITYTVAGEPAALFGSDEAWNINNENGLMTLEDGIYTWTSEPTALEGNVAFRVVKNNSWDVAYPSGNYNINNIKPGTYTLTVTLNPATGEVNATLNGQVDVYVFGYINDLEFVPNQGVKMETEDGKIYTTTISTYAVENGYSFFAFTNKLGASASDWEGLNANRFMAQSYGDFLVNGATMNIELPLAYISNYCMKVPAGEYTLTVDMENMKLTIAGGTQLSYILTDGVEGVDYTIINDLAVVEKNEATSQLFVSDGNDNWIAVNAGSNFADLASLKGGFTSGTVSGLNLNPVFTLSMAPVEGEDVDPVEPVQYSLANAFAPKVNEVVIISKAYYKASDGALRAYAPGNSTQGQSLTVDTSFGDFEFIDGQMYTVQGVINIKEPWSSPSGINLMDYDFPFQNYTIKVTDVTEEATPTAINGIFLEEGVKSVRFYNAAGLESKTPFQGVNIVVKEMIDGSKVATKVIFK